jgi:hypothetical protein
VKPLAQPLRPPPTGASPGAVEVPRPLPDCVQWGGSNAPPPVKPSDADRALAEQLAQAAGAALKRMMEPDVDFATRIDLVQEATDRAIASLQRDPYNPRATVVLGLVYRLLHRKTCVRNLSRRRATYPGTSRILLELAPDSLGMPDE